MPENQTEPIQPNQPPVEEFPTLVPKKKSKKWLWISLVGILVLILVGVGIWIWLAKPFSKEGLENKESKQATSSANTNTSTKERKIERFVYSKGADIYSIKIDGTAELKLASGQNPKVSSDFNKVIFENNYQLWVINVDGNGQKQLTTVGKIGTTNYLPVSVEGIGWSFDGKKILYLVKAEECMENCPVNVIEDPTVSYGVYVYDFDKKGSQFITSKGLSMLDYVGWPLYQENPIFVDFSKSDESLYTLNTTDGSFTKFSNQKYPGWISGGQMSISSNGKFITWSGGATESQPGLNVATNSSQIFLANIDGKNRKTISALGHWAEYQWPKYLPGSKFISYYQQLDLDGNMNPYLYDATTGKYQYFTSGKRFFFLDATTLLIQRGFGNEAIIYKLNTETGKESLFVKNASMDPNTYH